MKKALVSIAMPVRNCEETVAKAVRSILNQTFPDWELILIDDGSTDETLEQLRLFKDERIAILHDGRSKGLPTRLNEAVAVASGDYLARMDGDDVSYPERLQWQLNYLRLHPNVDMVGGGVLVFGEGGRIIGKRIYPENHDDICRRPYAGFPLAHPTYFGKTGWFRRHAYREHAVLAQDQELLLRARGESVYANLPCIVLGYCEERLTLGKILRTRRLFARIILAEFMRHGDPITGWRGFLEQYLKGGFDIFAVLTGLKYHLWRHRARPVASVDVEHWRQVWQSVQCRISTCPQP